MNDWTDAQGTVSLPILRTNWYRQFYLRVGMINCTWIIAHIGGRMEDMLQQDKASNLANNILASENEIIDRLLNRSLEMRSVYAGMARLQQQDRQGWVRAYFN